uniref:CUB domain-containing protein n=1 Tax=Timema douglasi TaxID=61478 RepID=A0A7R8Z9E9_TIMDO|nr:unnamed protein product [Timema douglasi]
MHPLVRAAPDCEHKTKFCNEEINVAEEGFVMSPGYPIYYVNKDDCYWLLKASPGQRVQVTLLDMSLRSTGPRESNCTDHLQVIEDGRVMMDECGELAKAIVIMSEGNMLNLTFTGLSQNMFPKRGVLFHYKAQHKLSKKKPSIITPEPALRVQQCSLYLEVLPSSPDPSYVHMRTSQTPPRWHCEVHTIGCVQLNPPKDGYMVFRNQTDAQFMCCVDYMFPDTLDRLRDLHCHNGNTWNNSLPDCITDKSLKPWGWIGTPMPTNSLKDTNITNSHTAAIVKESDFVFGIGKVELEEENPHLRGERVENHLGKPPLVHPTEIRTSISPSSAVELNTTSAKIPQNGDQEELDGIIQPQDGSVCDKPINV